MPGQLVIIVVVVVVAAAVFTVAETMYHAIFVAQGKEPIFSGTLKRRQPCLKALEICQFERCFEF